MGKLAASILAADLARLGEQVKQVEPYAEVIHVDIMDGHFVPPIALGTVVVASLRPVTSRTLHGHLMVDAPESLLDELAEAGLDVVPEIDGGVKIENAERAVDAGATVLVSASGIFAQPDPAAAARALAAIAGRVAA